MEHQTGDEGLRYQEQDGQSGKERPEQSEALSHSYGAGVLGPPRPRGRFPATLRSAGRGNALPKHLELRLESSHSKSDGGTQVVVRISVDTVF